MKKILLILSLVSIMASAGAQEIKWMNINDALAAAQESPKKIFIDVYTEWCGWCKRMDKTTFSNPVIAQYINDNFYPVKLDAETRDTIVFKGYTFTYKSSPDGRSGMNYFAYAILNGKTSFPSYVILNDEQNLMTVIKGYHEADKFEPILHFYAEDAYKTTQWDAFRAEFKSKLK